MKAISTARSLTILLVLAATGALAAPPPRPTKSEYLVTTGAGFAMTAERGVYYGMNYAFRKPRREPLFAVALFDNPEDPAAPLRNEVTIEAEAKDLMLQSPPLKVLTNGQRYKVELLLYADAEHTKLLGKHVQELDFSVPPELASQIEQRFGIKIW